MRGSSIERNVSTPLQPAKEAGATHPPEWQQLAGTFARHPLRIIVRAAWLGGSFAIAAWQYFIRVGVRRNPTAAMRAQWLQSGCRRVLRVFHVSINTGGDIPGRGLLVCNHLSYLDIIVLGAIAPAKFVSKSEVRGWPVFGWFAHLAGTVFVRREQRSDARRSTSEIQDALDAGSLVVLFPEGTSSDGATVLPFKSVSLSVATNPEIPLTAGFICYAMEDGSVADEVCYWRDMTLVPHLLNLLGKRSISARVSFAPVVERSSDRKQLARELQARVSRLMAERL